MMGQYDMGKGIKLPRSQIGLKTCLWMQTKSTQICKLPLEKGVNFRIDTSEELDVG